MTGTTPEAASPAGRLDRHERRRDFVYFLTIQTHWGDNDGYRHLNNTRYHAFFDTTLMHYLAVEAGIDVHRGETVPYTVENLCRFHRQVSFPAVVECGLRVAHIGNSSVRYEFGLFSKNSEEVNATGYFVDVFVSQKTQRPVRIPATVRTSLQRLSRPH